MRWLRSQFAGRGARAQRPFRGLGCGEQSLKQGSASVGCGDDDLGDLLRVVGRDGEDEHAGVVRR